MIYLCIFFRPLFNCAMKATYFPVEDVWITGIIATRCKVPTYHAHVITQWNFESKYFLTYLNRMIYSTEIPNNISSQSKKRRTRKYEQK